MNQERAKAMSTGHWLEANIPEWPRRPEDAGQPADVSYMLPLMRAGHNGHRPYHYGYWAARGAPRDFNLCSVKHFGCQDKFDHCVYHASTDKRTRYGDEAVFFAHRHLRQEDISSPLMKWIHRKCDERHIDLSQRRQLWYYYWFLWLFVLPYTVFIIGGSMAHFRGKTGWDGPDAMFDVTLYCNRSEDFEKSLHSVTA